MSAGRKALLVASYAYKDAGLRQLTSPAHDAEAFAEVLEDPDIAGFDVTMLVNEPHHVVGEAIADFYSDRGRDDLTLLYFTGHGVKDDDGRLYLAMSNTRRNALMFTAISAAQVNDAMDACRSRRKVLVLDCCYSGAFPAGRGSKSDEGVQTLERFQGKGRAVLTASDATQYAFEGDDVLGSGTQSLFTHFLVEAIRTGDADLDEDGDIALDELYSYVHERVVGEMPQQRPKKLEDVDGRIVIARNVHWRLPAHLQHAIESPIAAQRLSAVDGLGHLHRVGNEVVRAAVLGQLAALAEDDSRSVAARAGAVLQQLNAVPAAAPGTDELPEPGPPTAVAQTRRVPQVQAREEAHVRRQPDLPTRGDQVRAGRDRRAPDVASPGSAGRPAGPPERDRSRAGAAWQARRPPLTALLALLVTALALGYSRLAVFESTNGYRASSLGYSTPQWTLGVVVPVLVGAALLGARTERPRVVALAVGLLAGAAVALTDVAVSFLGSMLDKSIGYTAGPGWWSTLVALVVLAGCVVVLARQPPFGTAPTVRRDWPAVLGAVVVLAALGWWISRFHPDVGWWFGVYCQGVLLAAACLGVAVLGGDPQYRIAGLAAVTVAGAWVVGTQWHVLATQSYWTTAGDNAGALAAAVVMVGACYLAQLAPGRRRDARAAAAG